MKRLFPILLSLLSFLPLTTHAVEVNLKHNPSKYILVSAFRLSVGLAILSTAVFDIIDYPFSYKNPCNCKIYYGAIFN